MLALEVTSPAPSELADPEGAVVLDDVASASEPLGAAPSADSESSPRSLHLPSGRDGGDGRGIYEDVRGERDELGGQRPEHAGERHEPEDIERHPGQCRGTHFSPSRVRPCGVFFNVNPEQDGASAVSRDVRLV